MSDSDLSGRLLAPVMARPRRPLSNNASTDSCSMRFSLRTMMSGAFSSIRRFRRLLRLMTRRYRSFRSDVAKRPPSSGTSGRSSGGMTGTTVRIIHSGRFPESMKASTTFSRFTSFFGFSPASQPAVLGPQEIAQPLEIDRLQERANGFRPDHGGEAVGAVLVLCAIILVFGQKL